MSRFHEFGFEERLVNLDHVRTINVRREKPDKCGAEYSIFVRYADDSSETFRSGYDPELERHTAPIVSANPGFERLSFWFADDEGYEPTADNVTAIHNRTPIVAWRLTNPSPEPIAFDSCEPDPGEGLVAVLRPDGAVVVAGEESFENLDKWAEYVCRRRRPKASNAAPRSTMLIGRAFGTAVPALDAPRKPPGAAA